MFVKYSIYDREKPLLVVIMQMWSLLLCQTLWGAAVVQWLAWWSDGLRLFEADIVCFNETANMDAREYSGGGSQCDINITNRLF